MHRSADEATPTLDGQVAASFSNRLRRMSLLTIFAAAASACAPSDRAASDRDATLIVLYPADERSWAFYMPSQFLVFLPLARRDSTGQLRGWLARSWEHTADHRSWTFHLRSGIRWHDGRPVTARDVEFTMDLLARPEVGGISPTTYDISVIDDTTYTVRLLGRPEEWWLDYVVFYPKHLLEKLDPGSFYQWDFWTRPIGNGPFRYVRHQGGTMMEFEANAEYFEGRPRIDRLVLKFGQPAVTELLSGNVDAIPWIPEAELLKLGRDARYRVYSATKPEHLRTILWNHRHPALADARVRRALTLAIDRRELSRGLNLPAGTPLFDVIFTRDQYYRAELPSSSSHDRSAAERLLAQTGWIDRNGDGIREHNGMPLRLTALASAGQGLDRAAVFVQAALRRVGVQLNIATLEPQTVLQRIRSGDFEAAFHVVNTDLEGDLGHRDLFGAASRLGYRNARVSALLDRAASTLNPEELDRSYRELWPIFSADAPVTFLYPLVRTTAAHRRVRGLSSPWRDDPLWYAAGLWLEGSR